MLKTSLTSKALRPLCAQLTYHYVASRIVGDLPLCGITYVRTIGKKR